MTTNDSEIPELTTYYMQNKNNIKIAHVNINSIRNKFLPISNVLQKGLLDILFIQETKLDRSFPMCQFNIPGYKLYRNDYTNNAGGIMAYVRTELAPVRHSELEVNTDVHGRVESLAVEIHIKDDKWILYSVYKQPIVKDCDLKILFDDITSQCTRNFKCVVIIGDLNINFMKENNCLVDTLDLYGLKNIVKEPTCTKSKNSSIIDVVLTNMTKSICNVKCIECGLSDVHNMVCFSTKAFAPANK